MNVNVFRRKSGSIAISYRSRATRAAVAWSKCSAQGALSALFRAEGSKSEFGIDPKRIRSPGPAAKKAITEKTELRLLGEPNGRRAIIAARNRSVFPLRSVRIGRMGFGKGVPHLSLPSLLGRLCRRDIHHSHRSGRMSDGWKSRIDFDAFRPLVIGTNSYGRKIHPRIWTFR